MIYSRVFTVSASSSEEFEVEVEGDVISFVRIRFPPGPSGLLKVAIDYGIKRIFPCEEGEWFYGDDEIIQWTEDWTLPETLCKLKIRAVNEDDTYDHKFYLVLQTKWKRETMEYKIAERLIGFFKYLFGRR